MASTYVRVTDPAGFADGFFVDWSERPGQFPPNRLAPVTIYDNGTHEYDWGDQKITIDTAGPQVSMSICDANFFSGCFHPGDSVLLGENSAGQMPVHLVFDPPVRGVGTRIGADGPADVPYIALLYARDAASREWDGLSQNATLSRLDDSAPFVGVRARGQKLIDEVWFDVVSPVRGREFAQVAINQLYFLPK